MGNNNQSNLEIVDFVKKTTEAITDMIQCLYGIVEQGKI